MSNHQRDESSQETSPTQSLSPIICIQQHQIRPITSPPPQSPQPGPSTPDTSRPRHLLKKNYQSNQFIAQDSSSAGTSLNSTPENYVTFEQYLHENIHHAGATISKVDQHDDSKGLMSASTTPDKKVNRDDAQFEHKNVRHARFASPILVKVQDRKKSVRCFTESPDIKILDDKTPDKTPEALRYDMSPDESISRGASWWAQLQKTLCVITSFFTGWCASSTEKVNQFWLRRSLNTTSESSGPNWLHQCCKSSDKVEEEKDWDLGELACFLDDHKSFIQNYVLDSMTSEQLEHLYLLKIESEMNSTAAAQNNIVHFGKKEFMDIINGIPKESSQEEVLVRLAVSVRTALKAEACQIFKIIPGNTEDIVEVFSFNEKENKLGFIKVRDAHVTKAARSATCMTSTRLMDSIDVGFAPRSVFKKDGVDEELDLKYAMVIPIMVENEEVSHIIEAWRSYGFDQSDVKIGASFSVWASIAYHYYTLLADKNKEFQLTDFLLKTVKAIFEEMVSLDQVIKRILHFAQKLVGADRASLFLVDTKNGELVSTVFDLKLNDQDSKEKREIRMPITRGIAGHVAVSGEHVNISNAYNDERFNREVDEETGYETTSILCMPVKIEGKIIGVVQMVNKQDADEFSPEDVKSFKVFATFFGLALHHARLYDMITRKEQKYKVALEVLSYHNTCREVEVEELVTLEPHNVPFVLNDYYLDPFALNVKEKCQAVMIMFDDLFNMKNFESLNITRFILTVKKNYRGVPYHNFNHGWSVAQTMYAILKNDEENHFRYTQRLALFVASLCHDLDHRGYTNKYMSETASPLAAMYTTSTLEHHHFNITVTILQQDGHNIFSRFTSEQYKHILGLIRTSILATDLATFFPNLIQMKKLCSDSWSYDWENLRHRELAMAMSMTAADLSASAKPWDVQNKTVKVIFEEFYSQGDKEKAAGRTPIPMMDRSKPEEQPASQVGFLKQICIPCYNILESILPTTADLLKMACENLKNWEERAKHVAKNEVKAIKPKKNDQDDEAIADDTDEAK